MKHCMGMNVGEKTFIASSEERVVLQVGAKVFSLMLSIGDTVMENIVSQCHDTFVGEEGYIFSAIILVNGIVRSRMC